MRDLTVPIRAAQSRVPTSPSGAERLKRTQMTVCPSAPRAPRVARTKCAPNAVTRVILHACRETPFIARVKSGVFLRGAIRPIVFPFQKRYFTFTPFTQVAIGPWTSPILPLTPLPTVTSFTLTTAGSYVPPTMTLHVSSYTVAPRGLSWPSTRRLGPCPNPAGLTLDCCSGAPFPRPLSCRQLTTCFAEHAGRMPGS